MSGLTPTQSCMLSVLSDGLPHSRHELHECLVDDLGSLSNIRAHVCNIRKKLRPQGQDIACELFSGEAYYRLVSQSVYASTS